MINAIPNSLSSETGATSKSTTLEDSTTTPDEPIASVTRASPLAESILNDSSATGPHTRHADASPSPNPTLRESPADPPLTSSSVSQSGTPDMARTSIQQLLQLHGALQQQLQSSNSTGQPDNGSESPRDETEPSSSQPHINDDETDDDSETERTHQVR